MTNVKEEGLLYEELVKKVFSVEENSFEKRCLEVFNYQYQNNDVYKCFVDSLKIDPTGVKNITRIPFLPIEFFKTHEIRTKSQILNPKSQIFLSSGTTGQTQSKHFVSDISIYEKSFMKGFELFYGNVKDHCILALLPSYLEREGSSLIYMCDDLIKHSKNEHSGFYLDDLDQLISKINLLEKAGQRTILIGVTYALLDLIEKQSFDKLSIKLKHTIIMETGGMKGKREEMVREELHKILCGGFGVTEIHSEYGMTELLSQAYSKGKGIFKTPSWMKILIRDTEDPFHFLENGRTGGINVIDLANINSCSFIATQDLGRTHADKTFEVLGRFDNSDLRGCNLLVD